MLLYLRSGASFGVIVVGKHWSLAQADALLTRSGSRFEVGLARIDGYDRRIWKTAPASLSALLARATRFSDREFLIYGTSRVRFGGFLRAVLALADDLRARGVVPGDRVALAMRNRPAWPVAFFAVIQAGALVVPLNAWWTAEELAAGLADCGARFAIVDAERQERLPELQHVWSCGSTDVEVGCTRLEDVTGLPDNWQHLPERTVVPTSVSPDDDAAIFYTSGTASSPRGVLLSHRNMLDTIMAMAYTQARAHIFMHGAAPSADFLENPSQTMLLSVPLFHVIGACAVLMPALYNGARLVLMPKWEPQEALGLIEREKISQIWGVPAIARALIDHPARSRYDLSSLRLVSYGGAPCAASLAGEVTRHLAPAQPGLGWGMTETASLVTGHCGPEYYQYPDSCGVPPPTCALKVTDPAGQSLPCGEAGELWVSGPNVAKGYWGRPQESAGVFVGGWVRTGDLARLDEDGRCTIVGRTKDMVIRGGENIYCGEVETVLASHPAVREAALFPLPDDLLGEEPAALVVLRREDDVSEAALKLFAASRLAAYKVPVQIGFVAALPRNAGGKLQRGQLLALLNRQTAAAAE